ncbi:MAG: transcription elongation factor GreA [Candidatus Kerfeldbacteria bacterium]
MNKLNDQVTFITSEGKQKLIDELDDLVNIQRIKISKRIQEAKELGDLSENAEYAEAKNDQAFNDGRILEVKATLRTATVIKKDKGNKNKIGLGAKIKIKEDDKTLEYHIVGFNEADPAGGKISNESPIGQAFLGKIVGDIVEIDIPSGKKRFEILSIS